MYVRIISYEPIKSSLFTYRKISRQSIIQSAENLVTFFAKLYYAITIKSEESTYIFLVIYSLSV